MNLHGHIMSLPQTPGLQMVDATEQHLTAYKCGHRDARHAAAELALKADAEMAELRLLVRGIVDNRHLCFVPNDKDGLFNWDERAARVLGDA